jgi:hypothetical protein
VHYQLQIVISHDYYTRIFYLKAYRMISKWLKKFVFLKEIITLLILDQISNILA